MVFAVAAVAATANTAMANTAVAGTVPPKLSIVGPSSISAVVRGGAGDHSATINVVVENAGDTATGLRGDVLIDDSPNPGCHSTHVIPQLSPTSVAPHSATAVRIIIPVAQDCAGRSGTLLLAGTAGVDAAAARFTLTRTLGGPKTSLPALVAAVFTLASVWLLIRLAKGVWFLTSGGVAIGPGWTLSGSWLTNVGALGAIIGSVLGASSYLSDLVPGLSTAPFVGLSLAYGGIIVAAPVVYYAFSKQAADPTKPNTNATVTIGSSRGLVALMALTLFGIYGELATVALLIHESNRPWYETIPLTIALAVAAIAAGTYAVRNTRDTIHFAINNATPAQLSGVAL